MTRSVQISAAAVAAVVVGVVVVNLATAQPEGEAGRAAGQSLSIEHLPPIVTARPATVSTSGEAIVYVEPDEVLIHFGIEIVDRSLDEAVAQMETRSSKLIAAVKGLKVEAKDMQATTMSTRLIHKNRNAAEGIEAYRVSKSFSVLLRDVSSFEKAIQTVLKNGANELNGFEYRTSELRKHRDAARAMAVKAAKEKAAALAGELGHGIGQPLSINESQSWSYGSWNRANSFQNVQVSAQGDGPPDVGAGTLPTGRISIRANVSASFVLE